MEKTSFTIDQVTCWVITEGMIGTENQCVAIAESLGIKPKIIQCTLKEPWKTLSPWLGFEHAYVFTPNLPRPPWPDLLLVSGRKAIAAARYIKRSSNGCTQCVYIQDPKINSKAFDLVIAPQHDSIRGNNVFKTIAAPNRIRTDKLDAALKDFPEIASMPSPCAAVMIGGDSRTHVLTDGFIDRICKQMQALTAQGTSLLVTTSRRTGDVATRHIRDSLQSDIDSGRVYMWDQQGVNPYFAMLARADVLMVSNDSASMLSEAATTGKPVYSLAMEARHSGKKSRLAGLEQRLIDYGALRRYEGGALESWDYQPLNDADKAAEIIEQHFTKIRQSSI